MWACDRLTRDVDFAHFDLCGYVNKQNSRIWGTENSHTHTFKSRRTQNNLLFGADFGPKIEEEYIGNISFQQDGATCCDLTPLDYYLWCADKCYADKPDAINALKDNIREAIGEIHLHIIDVLRNSTDRVGYCMAI